MRMRTDVSPIGSVASLDGVKARIARAVSSMAAEAAAIYEQLSKLSDAELNRRGLSRATLASDIARAWDRTNG